MSFVPYATIPLAAGDTWQILPAAGRRREGSPANYYSLW